MTRSPWCRLLCPAAVAVALALMPWPFPRTLSAQERKDGPVMAQRRKALLEGTHVFRRILADTGLQPLDSFQALQQSPRRSILVVLGDLSPIEKLGPGGLSRFIREGGAVLLASDRPVHGATRDELLATASVTINSETLVMADGHMDGTNCYRNLDYCPLVRSNFLASPQLFRDPDPRSRAELRVATNTPSMLLLKGPPDNRWPTQLASLPPGCQVEGQQPFRGQRQPLFMVGGDLGDGRALVLADHSVFINEMMLPEDNSNVEFAFNCVNWLRGDRRERDKALFFEEGSIQTKFDLPVRPAALSPAEALRMLFARRNALLAQAGEALTRLEDGGKLDDQLMNLLARQGLPPSRLAWYAVVLGTIALVLFLVYRLGIRGRFRHDTTAPPLTTAVGDNFPHRPLIEQRTQALLRGQNLAEPAAALLRRWFARCGAEVVPGSGPPPFEVTAGGWWRRRRTVRRLRALWRQASGRERARLGPPGLWALQRELEALAADWRRGEWAVARAGRAA